MDTPSSTRNNRSKGLFCGTHDHAGTEWKHIAVLNLFCSRQRGSVTQFGQPVAWPRHRDTATGESLDPDLPRDIARDEWQRLTESPRRYGFHATLKPPFRLAENTTFAGLKAAVRDFAGRHESFAAPPLGVAKLGNFLALTLSEPSPEFASLAADSVEEFDRFRAPASEQELAQRLDGSLSSHRREHVLRWGCPYADGRFPDRSPDCASASNLTRLRSIVRGRGNSIGIAWDGDGDRVAFVDEEGDYVSPDEIAILFACAALNRQRTCAKRGRQNRR
jgi:hypothetical protein